MKLNFLKKYWMVSFLIVLIVFAYLLFRLPNLTLQPVFADEAIYIRWAQVMKAEPTLRFLPLSDGKTPLFMWAMAPMFKIFADPLFAGRFLSVLAGLGTLAGAFFLGWKFFNLRVALWAGFLIAATPFIVFFDRMALVDSMLAAFSIWALNLSLLLIQYKRIDLAMVLGYVLGAGMLTKTPGFFNVLVLPVTLLAFNWKGGQRQRELLKVVGLWAIVLGITFIIYNLLRLGPGFLNLSARNQDYIFSPLDLIGRPLDPFIPHLRDLQDWLPKLLTWPTLLLVTAGVILAFLRKQKTALVILGWALVPLLIEMALLKTFTARYILFSIPPLLCLGAWALDELSSRYLKIGKDMVNVVLLAVLLPLPLLFNIRLLTHPEGAPLPRAERKGYFEDWTAGYGFREIAEYLKAEAGKETVVVGTEGYFGTLPEGLQIYLEKYFHEAPRDKQVIVIGGQATISADIRQAAKDHPTYFVANQSRFSKNSPGVTLIAEYLKPKGNLPQDSILLFKVDPTE